MNNQAVTRNSAADVIVFAGVVFMAETAKILCPDALVVVPDIASGCSLADSLTGATYFMLLTECGLVSRVEVENPGKQFIGSCRLCPYMKLNSLKKIRDVLVAPQPHQVIELDETVRVAALRCIERMFELTD